MKKFKEMLNRETIISESDSVLKIKLQDGDMIVKSKEVNGNMKVEISYNGNIGSYFTNDDYEASKATGDVATLLNMLIQEFHMSGTVKSK
jgi:hypothetical protein